MALMLERDAFFDGYLRGKLSPYDLSSRVLSLCLEPENRQLILLCVETNPSLLVHLLAVASGYETLVGALGKKLGWSEELQGWLWGRMGWVLRHDMGKLLNGEDSKSGTLYAKKSLDQRRHHVIHPFLGRLLLQSLDGAQLPFAMRELGHHRGMLPYFFVGDANEPLYRQWETWLYDGTNGLEELLFTTADVSMAMGLERPHSNLRYSEDSIVHTLERHLDFEKMNRVFEFANLTGYFVVREAFIEEALRMTARMQKKVSTGMGLGVAEFQQRALQSLGQDYLQMLKTDILNNYRVTIERVLSGIPDDIL